MSNFPKTFFIQSVLFFPTIAFGQGLKQAPVPLNIAPPSGSGTTILNILNFVFSFIGTIVVAYLIYGIFRYFTASNNEDQLAESKSTMMGALISIFAVGISAALINFVVNAISGNLSSGGGL